MEDESSKYTTHQGYWLGRPSMSRGKWQVGMAFLIMWGTKDIEKFQLTIPVAQNKRNHITQVSMRKIILGVHRSNPSRNGLVWSHNKTMMRVKHVLRNFRNIRQQVLIPCNIFDKEGLHIVSKAPTIVGSKMNSFKSSESLVGVVHVLEWWILDEKSGIQSDWEVQNAAKGQLPALN